MDKSELGKKLVELVRQRDWVTFVEVAELLEDHGVNTKGNNSYEAQMDNVIFWAGMSSEMIEVFEPLLDNKELFFHPMKQMDLHVLLLYGGCLKIPIVKHLPPGGFKTPHWLPVYFRTVPIKRRR